MRPLQSADAKHAGAFAFRLYTYDRTTRTENCNGTIKIHYAPVGQTQEHDSRDSEISREVFEDQLNAYGAVQEAAIAHIEDGVIYKLLAHLDSITAQHFAASNPRHGIVKARTKLPVRSK